MYLLTGIHKNWFPITNITTYFSKLDFLDQEIVILRSDEQPDCQRYFVHEYSRFKDIDFVEKSVKLSAATEIIRTDELSQLFVKLNVPF